MTIEYIKLHKCKTCGCLATPLLAPDNSGFSVTMYFCGTCNRWFERDQVEWVKVECEKLSPNSKAE